MKRGFLLPFFIFFASALPPQANGAVSGSAANIGAPNAVLEKKISYVTPRENLTKVANALRMQTYSLSTFITVPGGLGLTQPVAIRVNFHSYSGNSHSDYVERLYDDARGARLIINDKEGLGTPRQATLRINLFEYPPGWTGGHVLGTGSFDFPERRYNLDPLYDVFIRPIQVTRIQDCAMLTNSDVGVRWFAPDRQQHEAVFRFGANKVALVPNSEWRAQEINVAKNYRMPNVGLYGFHIPSAPATVNLIPAPQAYAFSGPMPVQEIKFQQYEPNRGCKAQVQYVIERKIRRYVDPLNPAATGVVQDAARAK